MNIQSTQNISRYLAQNARRISSTPFPLEKLEMAKIEGIQKGIKLFEGLKMQDIKFLSKWFQVLNLARGCREGCTFCLRNAQVPIKETLTQINTILWEDLQRFVDGFSKLSERIGENILNGNSHVTLFEDANLPVAKIKDLNGEKYSIRDAIDSVYTKLGLPLVFVTAGWHLNDKTSQKSAEEICKYIQDNPNCVKEFGISVNSFHKYKEDVYIEKMANTLKTFLPLYKNGFEKGIVIFKYNFDDGIDSDKNGYESAKKLYEKIYEKLKQISDSNLEEYEILKPQNVCKHKNDNYIENKGRGQKFFLPELVVQNNKQLFTESFDWAIATVEEKAQRAYEYTTKNVDINGNIYLITPSEQLIETDIGLNFINKSKNTAPIHTDQRFYPFSSR